MCFLLFPNMNSCPPITRVATQKASYKTLVAKYGAEGKWRDVLNLFESMAVSHVHPDVTTYGAVMLACARVGDVERALEVWWTTWCCCCMCVLLDVFCCVCFVLLLFAGHVHVICVGVWVGIDMCCVWHLKCLSPLLSS